MRNVIYYSMLLLWLLTACNPSNPNVKTPAALANTNDSAANNQLYLFQENASADDLLPDESLPAGSLYLTAKGNIIYTSIAVKSDTQRFYYGKYRLSDSLLQFELNNEFYFPGKWDARWDVEHPDFEKGLTRAIQPITKILLRSSVDSCTFFLPYTASEKQSAAKRHKHDLPKGISFWPYHEPTEQKFYVCLYKHVPQLAKL